MIKIDKGIPAPRGPYQTKYPWRELEVGDSFFAPGKTRGMIGTDGAQKATGFTFAARTITENGVRGLRVWRTA